MFKFELRGMDISHKYDEIPVATADKEFDRHYHNFYEIFYFISGTAMYTVENEKQPLHPHDGLIIRPGEFHNVQFLDKTPYERYVLKLPVGYMLPYLEKRLQARSAFFPRQHGAIEMFSRLDKAYETYTGDDLYYYAGCVAIEAVISFCNSNETPTTDYNLDNAKILSILEYINENIRKPLTLTQLAEIFQYSPDYLNRSFYRYMKTPLMKYIRTKRAFEAHKLLISGCCPTQVAEMMGFSDYSSFYRAYVSAMGKTPSKDYTKKSSTFFTDY